MIVLHFPTVITDRILSGEQTVVTYPNRRLVWHHGVVPLTDLAGQPVGIARLPIRAVPGAIVGSGRVAVVVPVVSNAGKPFPLPCIFVTLRAAYLVRSVDDEWEELPEELRYYTDLSDGRTAVILTDAAPCEQRCLYCLVKGSFEPGLPGCPPIPYDHPGAISEWTP